MGINLSKTYIPFLLPIIASLITIGALIANAGSNFVVMTSYAGALFVEIGYAVLLLRTIPKLIALGVGEVYLSKLLVGKSIRSIIVYLVMLMIANAIGYLYISSLIAFVFAVLSFSNSCQGDSILVKQLILDKVSKPQVFTLILGANGNHESARPEFGVGSSINLANGQAMTGYTDSSGCLPGCGTPSWSTDTYTSNPSSRYD